MARTRGIAQQNVRTISMDRKPKTVARELFPVLSVDEYNLDDALADCRFVVILDMMFTLMDKVQRNGTIINDLKTNRVSPQGKIHKQRRRQTHNKPLQMPLKLRAKAKKLVHV